MHKIITEITYNVLGSKVLPAIRCIYAKNVHIYQFIICSIRADINLCYAKVTFPKVFYRFTTAA